jgi:pimeloyl-CoA dehydrogenase
VLDGVPASGDRIVGPLGGALPLVQRAVDRAEAALCAEAAGALDALIQITAEHLRTRRQFGSPLAKFQALQHRVADMAIALEQLKSMACAAALALQADSDAERRRLLRGGSNWRGRSETETSGWRCRSEPWMAGDAE